MAYTNTHLRLTWGGKVIGGDIWSNSLNLRFQPGLGAGDSIPESFLQEVNLKGYWDAIKKAYTSTARGMCAFYSLEYVKLAVIGTNGKYIGEAKEYTEGSTVNTHLAGNQRTPTDTLAVSLLTEKNRGKGHRGRIFPPAFNINVEPNGRVDEQYLNDYAQLFSTMLTEINDVDYTYGGGGLQGQTAGHGTVAVMSKIGAGVTSDVTEVSVGNVFDVQRRRRNRFVEVYRGKPVTGQ